jgi:hypothetical protein
MILQGRRVPHDGVGIHMGRDIRLLPVLLGVAVQHRVAQVIDGGGNLNFVALGLHALKRVEQAFEDAQVGRRADGAGIGREAEKDDPHLLLGIRLAPQGGQALRLFHEAVDPFEAGGHRLAVGRPGAVVGTAVAALRPMTPAEDGRVRRAVDLRQGHQHRRLDRAKPAFRRGPLPKRLELDRMRRDDRARRGPSEPPRPRRCRYRPARRSG